MAGPPDAPSQDDAEDAGFLLGLEGGVSAAELFDPVTGRAKVLPGVPIDPAPLPPEHMRIGVIDSGVLPDHPQLRNRVVAMRDFAGDDPVDRLGHGTLVALQALAGAGSDAATAHPVGLVSAKVTGPDGRIALDHVIAAMDWMAEQRIMVVNMSLGFLGKAAAHARLCEAIARHEATLFVVAAGNFGPHVKVYPAACEAPNLMRVGAVIGGEPWAQSGQGDVYAEGRVTVVPMGLHFLEEGLRAREAGQLDRARELFARSLEAEETAGALLGLADVAMRQGDPAAACGFVACAAALRPDDAEIAMWLGTALLAANRPAEALREMDRAIALDPGLTGARLRRAQVLARLGEPGRALEELAILRRGMTDRREVDAIIVAVAREAGLL